MMRVLSFGPCQPVWSVIDPMPQSEPLGPYDLIASVRHVYFRGIYDENRCTLFAIQL